MKGENTMTLTKRQKMIIRQRKRRVRISLIIAGLLSIISIIALLVMDEEAPAKIEKTVETTEPETEFESPQIEKTASETLAANPIPEEEVERVTEEETTKNYEELIIWDRISYDYVNIRSAPNVNSDIYKTLEPKEVIHVTDERSDGWTEICLDNQIFYVKSEYMGKESGYQEYLDEQERKKDHTPYSQYLVDNYGFSFDKQKYLWEKCCTIYTKLENQQKLYAFVLGLMQRESCIGTYNNKSHWNSNGTRDLGIMQVNSCNWNKLKAAGIISSYDPYNLICDELQYNDYIGIDAGFYMLTPYLYKFGINENAYYAYNTGNEHGGSNNNSRIVWKYYQQWYSRLWE